MRKNICASSIRANETAGIRKQIDQHPVVIFSCCHSAPSLIMPMRAADKRHTITIFTPAQAVYR
jgi:hypothetical protein